MERESFENEEIAEILNQYFVSIKVDREERPDVDKIYMVSSSNEISVVANSGSDLRTIDHRWWRGANECVAHP